MGSEQAVKSRCSDVLRLTEQGASRIADFQVGCVAGFQTRVACNVERPADLENGDPASAHGVHAASTRDGSRPQTFSKPQDLGQ